MEQRFTIITLGTRDLAASISFFERLGGRRSGAYDGVAFFQCGCTDPFCLLPRCAGLHHAIAHLLRRKLPRRRVNMLVPVEHWLLFVHY